MRGSGSHACAAKQRGRGAAVLASLMSLRPRVRIPPAPLAIPDPARLARERSVRIPPAQLHGGRGVTAASWVVIPAVSVRIRPAAPSRGRRAPASSARCNRAAPGCGGSTPPVRTSRPRPRLAPGRQSRPPPDARAAERRRPFGSVLGHYPLRPSALSDTPGTRGTSRPPAASGSRPAEPASAGRSCR